MVVQQHHQNIQICTNNLVLKQIIGYVGVNVHLHITYVPGIPYLKNNLQLQHLTKHIHLHICTFIGLYYLKMNQGKNWFHTRNIWCHLLIWWIKTSIMEIEVGASILSSHNVCSVPHIYTFLIWRTWHKLTNVIISYGVYLYPHILSFLICCV